MNELFIAYERFWGQFINTFGSPSVNPTLNLPPGSPVLAHRFHAPENARYPLIVYDPIMPALFGNAVSIASVWDRDLNPNGAPGRPSFYGRVNDIAEQILDKIHPELGVDFQVGERGILSVYRGGVPFQIAPSGEDDPTFVRAIINLQIRGRLS